MLSVWCIIFNVNKIWFKVEILLWLFILIGVCIDLKWNKIIKKKKKEMRINNKILGINIFMLRVFIESIFFRGLIYCMYSVIIIIYIDILRVNVFDLKFSYI